MPEAEIAELRGVLERDGRLAFGAAFTKAAGSESGGSGGNAPRPLSHPR